MQKTTLAVLLIGNEILRTQVKEANYIPIARAVLQKGIVIGEVRIVQDDKEEIADAVRVLSKKYTYVITSGGVGPTHDDITLESIAHGFGVSPAKNDAMMQFLLSKDTAMNPARAKMAYLPQGSTLVHDINNNWPAIRFRNIFILPGLPRVLKTILPNVVAVLPQEDQIYYGYIVVSQQEQEFATALDELQRDFPDIAIGSYPSIETQQVKISLTGRHESDTLACFKELTERFDADITEKQEIEQISVSDEQVD